MIRRALLVHVAALALLAVPAGAATRQTVQGYPNPRREIRHIIPWGAGGATDAAMRGFMQRAETHVGLPIVTENIAGGLSAVGLLRVRTARPDGYTVGTMTYDVLTLQFQGLAPVSWNDFEPICMVTEHPSALIVPADRWRGVEDFAVDMRTHPGRIKVGNVGTGGIWHQHAAAMERALGGRVTHVPYEAGSGAQLAALLGGEVDAIVASYPAALPYVRAGRLSILAVMAEERDDLVPDAPTFTELGYDVVYGGFRVVVAPRGTPAEVLAYLERAFHDTWRDPQFQRWAAQAAIGAHWRGSDLTRTYLENLAAKVQRLMDELGLTGGSDERGRMGQRQWIR